MKILLFGKNGQVGWELARNLPLFGELVALGRKDADFSNPESLREIIQEVRPDLIVNSAAYTNVNKAEEDEELATIINGVAVGVLAEEAKKLNALLIHYSTDYVFDGKKETPYTEEDKPNPINAYGRSKLVGENLIKKVDCNHLIFRTSWVYSNRGKNFLKTILKLAQERDKLQVVEDQIGTPTSVRLIADVTTQVLDKLFADGKFSSRNYGKYNLTANNKTSWLGFAQLILKYAVENDFPITVLPEQIKATKTDNGVNGVKRPLSSCLDTTKIQSNFNIVLPNWENDVENVIISLKI